MTPDQKTTRCDACGLLAVKRGGVWVHADPDRAAQSQSGQHDPFKFDDDTAAYLAAALGGGDGR